MRRKAAPLFLLLAGLALWGAGCAAPAVGPVKPLDLTDEAGRAEAEINSALLRQGVAASEVRTGLRSELRNLSSPARVRWVHRSYTLIAQPTFRNLGVEDYASAVREGAGRAGARVAETVAGEGARRAEGAGSPPPSVRMIVRVPVEVAGRRFEIEAFEITIVPPGPDEGGAGGEGAGARPGEEGPARVAIIIDDFGYEQPFAEEFFALPVPLTMAVIPFLPASERLARTGQAHGWEVLVHLPMQPEAAALDRYAGTVRVSQSDAEIRRTVAADLAAVPFAVGVNNHQGSRATQDARVMDVVLEEVASRGLFFVDSRTSAASVAARQARRAGLLYGENYIFLDHRAEVGYVRQALRHLVRAAEANGYAIGIGHVRAETLKALREELPVLLAEGVRFAPVGEVVRTDFRYRRSPAPPSSEQTMPSPAPAVPKGRPVRQAAPPSAGPPAVPPADSPGGPARVPAPPSPELPTQAPEPTAPAALSPVSPAMSPAPDPFSAPEPAAPAPAPLSIGDEPGASSEPAPEATLLPAPAEAAPTPATSPGAEAEPVPATSPDSVP